MKKIFKVAFSLLMVMIIATTAFAFNASAASATISGTGEVEVGKNFNVTVRFNADATLYAVEATVTYNSSVLKLNSVSGADYNIGNGSVKIVDDGFSATKPSKTSSYTLNFTAIAAGDSTISATLLGGGEAESKASASAAVKVVAPKPSSNANLASIKLSAGSLSPAFNPNTTNYNVTVKYSVEEITITGSIADGKSRIAGGGSMALKVGNNESVITVTAEDGTKKSYIINVKRMSEQETADAEQAARDANPLLVIINDVDYTIVDNFEGITIPAGYTQGVVTRKETEIPVLNDEHGEYQLFWLVDANGENGAFYTRDENDEFTRLNYITANGKLYIIEQPDVEGILPEGYIKTTAEIGGREVAIYGYLNEELKDFYVVKCYVGGNRAYYQYDSLEGTMQRAGNFYEALAPDETDTSAEPIKQGKFAWFNSMTRTGKLVFAIIVFAAVLLIAAAVMLVVKIVSSNKEEFEDEYEYENNDFVLNDFADSTDNSDKEKN